MTIEPITALNLLLVCELTYSAGLLGGQKHFTGRAKIATGWAIAHPVNMLSEALFDEDTGLSPEQATKIRVLYGDERRVF